MILSLLALTMSAAADNYVLVVNETVPENPLPQRDLKRLISRQRCCWADGLEVALVFPPSEDTAMVWFVDAFTGLDGVVYRRYLMERCYRMGCTPMIGAPDLETAQEVAQRTPGAVTIAHRDRIPEGLRVLQITE